LPKENQKTVTIRKDVYGVAEKKAKKQKKSVAQFVTELIMEKPTNFIAAGEQKSKEVVE